MAYIRISARSLVAESSGYATIAAGNTSVTVTHGIGYVPDQNKILLTANDSLGGRTVFVDTLTASQFNINVDSADLTDHIIRWVYVGHW